MRSDLDAFSLLSSHTVFVFCAAFVGLSDSPFQFPLSLSCVLYLHPSIVLRRSRIHQSSNQVFALLQYHIDTEMLTSSLRMACHHPGGKRSKSPGCRVTHWADDGTTRSWNSGNVSSGCAVVEEKTSTREVFDKERSCGYIQGVADGGASQTVLRPTT